MYPSEKHYNEKTLRSYLAKTDNPAVTIFFEGPPSHANQCLVWPYPEQIDYAQQDIDCFFAQGRKALYGQDKRFRRYSLSVLIAVYGLRFDLVTRERRLEQRFLFELQMTG